MTDAPFVHLTIHLLFMQSSKCLPPPPRSLCLNDNRSRSLVMTKHVLKRSRVDYEWGSHRHACAFISIDRAHWQATEDTDRNRKIAMINMIKLMMITTVMITLIWVFVKAKPIEEKRRVQMRQSTNFGLPETSRMVLYRCEPSKIRIRFVETVKFTFIDWLIRFILLEFICWTDRRWSWEMFTDNDDERVEPMSKAKPLGGGRSMELINAIDPVSNGRIRIEPIFILIVEENHFGKASLASSVLEMSQKDEIRMPLFDSINQEHPNLEITVQSIRDDIAETKLTLSLFYSLHLPANCRFLFPSRQRQVWGEKRSTFLRSSSGSTLHRLQHTRDLSNSITLRSPCDCRRVKFTDMSRLLLDLVMRVFMSMFVAKDFSLQYLPWKKTAKKTDGIDQWIEVMNNSLCCLFRLFRG